jgi:hypothetical protein
MHLSFLMGPLMTVAVKPGPRARAFTAGRTDEAADRWTMDAAVQQMFASRLEWVTRTSSMSSSRSPLMVLEFRDRDGQSPES